MKIINNGLEKLSQMFITALIPKFHNRKFKQFIDGGFRVMENIILRFNPLITLYINWYEEAVKQEIQLGSLSSKDRILVIGSGSIPATSILLYQLTNADIISIDKNNQAVINAKRCIQQVSPNAKIHFIHSNAIDLDLTNFNTILIAYGVENILEILKHCYFNGNNKTKIILRSEKDRSINEYFLIKKYVSNYSIGPFQSMLLLKKEKKTN